MNIARPTEAPDLEILHQLFAAATHDASTAMSRWTNGLITLSLDEVCELPLEEVCSEFDFGDELMTMVVLSQGEATDCKHQAGGDMILTFDEKNGRQLAATLLRKDHVESEEWTALERSALEETGNILGCAYMNALTRLIGTELVPSPPYFVQDYGASVLEQALMNQAASCDKVLICRTSFSRMGEDLNWNVFFVPTNELRVSMEAALSGN